MRGMDNPSSKSWPTVRIRGAERVQEDDRVAAIAQAGFTWENCMNAADPNQVSSTAPPQATRGYGKEVVAVHPSFIAEPIRTGQKLLGLMP